MLVNMAYFHSKEVLMRSLYFVFQTVIIFSCLISVGRAQDAALDKSQLRARVESEVEDFTRNIPVDPRLQEQFGILGATYIHLSGRVAIALTAQMFPVDWFLHSEIVWPLTDAGFIPKGIPGVKHAPSSFDCVVIILRYGRDDIPKSEVPDVQSKIDRWLDTYKISGPIFGRKKSDADPRVLYVRDITGASNETTASVIVRCRVHEEGTSRIRELVAYEEWRFKPIDNKHQRCWNRINMHHYLYPCASPTTNDCVGRQASGLKTLSDGK
jgi:hypothetical protein